MIRLPIPDRKRLFIGNKFTGVSIEPDERWPDMWRIRQGDQLSEMVNLTRAKDAALTWARPRGLGGGETFRWDRRETRRAASLVR